MKNKFELYNELQQKISELEEQTRNLRKKKKAIFAEKELLEKLQNYQNGQWQFTIYSHDSSQEKISFGITKWDEEMNNKADEIDESKHLDFILSNFALDCKGQPKNRGIGFFTEDEVRFISEILSEHFISIFEDSDSQNSLDLNTDEDQQLLFEYEKSELSDEQFSALFDYSKIVNLLDNPKFLDLPSPEKIYLIKALRTQSDLLESSIKEFASC